MPLTFYRSIRALDLQSVLYTVYAASPSYSTVIPVSLMVCVNKNGRSNFIETTALHPNLLFLAGVNK
jgi:hypothetical protein